MARRKANFYNAIEYIGPRPQKAKKSNKNFGGWVIILIAVVVITFFAKPWIGGLMAANKEAGQDESEVVIDTLRASSKPKYQLAAEAMSLLNRGISHDPAYFKIDYPAGDVPRSKGVAADLIIRSYRSIGVDLQQLVHEDISENYRVYPQLWNSSKPDASIDHRRVPNLHRFFTRNSESRDQGRKMENYEVGDIIVWALPDAKTHIGIVVPAPNLIGDSLWVVHHPAGQGIQWEDALFDHQIIGHFNYVGPSD